MLIIRRSNCINTTSGIVLSVSDRPVCRLRRNFSTYTPDGISTIGPLDDEHSVARNM